jgi:hypothetical protein
MLKTGYGVGAFSLAGLAGQGGIYSVAQAADLAAAAGVIDPLAAKAPHFPAKAKSVIWLHQDGAPSSLDLFDYKPDLIKLAGTSTPDSFTKGIKLATRGGDSNKLFASKRQWKQYGQSGAWFSDLLPNLSRHADDIAFIKSSVTVGATHNISILKLNTGDVIPGRPSLGAWVQYALGTANKDLPAYVVLYNGRAEPTGGAVNWSAGFLPAVYQGTAFLPGDSPIHNLARPELLGASEQRADLDLLKRLNEHHASRYPADTELQARIQSYELAHRMQTTAPEAVDISKESAVVKALYGVGEKETNDYGTVLLRARRLVERGVRFVHVVSGPADEEIRNWDAHSDLEKNHGRMTKMVDKPVAGLLADLKARGLLDSTIVVWASEFGRTSFGESGNGRDHNPWGYTQWVAGGGFKAGSTYGETDAVGLQIADKDKAVDTYDLHATVLNQLGLDHLKVIFRNKGRAERPTVVYGKVIKDLIA